MRFLLALGGILGGAVPLASQAPQPPGFEESIVVTASLEAEAEDRLPGAVEVIDAEEIRARQATSVADLLATLPGIQVVRSGSPGQVTSLFTRGTESDHTLVLWNGVELNDPFFGGFNWAFLPTVGVERVEVVKGPFSSLYGGDALGGVVQVISGSPEGVALSLEGGENGYWSGAVSGGLESGSMRLQVAGQLRRGGGELANDDWTGEDFTARGDWLLGESLNVGLLARIAEADVGIPLSGGLPSPSRRISWRESQLAVPFEGEWGRWGVRGQLSRATYSNRFRDPEDPFGFTAGDTEARSLRAKAVASYRLPADHWLAFGAETDEARVDDRSVFGSNLDGERQRARALFVQALAGWGAMTFELGLRHDRSDSFGGRTSPRLGVVVSLGEGTSIRAAYGEAFRAPSIGELYFPLSGNPELRPETSASYELGLRHRRGPWRAEIALFHNQLEDLIDFDFATFRNFNVGRARSRGLEVALGWRRDTLSVRWNGTWLEARDLITDLELLRRPRLATHLMVDWRAGRWTLHWAGRWVGEREDIDPVTFGRAPNEAYARLDAAARWQLGPRLAPYARIDNLTDEAYSEALGFPAPGRTLAGGLALSW